MKNSYRIIFIVGSISQPRVIKRINSFIENGFEVEVYGFNRNKYNINANIEGVKVNVIGDFGDGKDYLHKIKKTITLYFRLRKVYNKKSDIFYFFGFMEAIGTLLFPSKYIYEISDILYVYKRFKRFEWLFKYVDKKLIKRSLITVMTSGGFKSFLTGKKEYSNVIIQPNKLSPYFHNINRNNICFKNVSDNIKFAFVGAFRYPNTIFRFAEVIGKHFPNHEFKFYGDSQMTNQVKNIAEKYANVMYYGEYKNPDDLEMIYQNVDFVVACYDPESLNERIAEPNKLYEAMYFKKPIIVTTGTYVEKQVEKFGCGFAIDASSDDNIIDFINSISLENILKIKKNIEKINSKNLIDDNAKLIIEKIRNIKV